MGRASPAQPALQTRMSPAGPQPTACRVPAPLGARGGCPRSPSGEGLHGGGSIPGRAAPARRARPPPGLQPPSVRINRNIDTDAPWLQTASPAYTACDSQSIIRVGKIWRVCSTQPLGRGKPPGLEKTHFKEAFLISALAQSPSRFAAGVPSLAQQESSTGCQGESRSSSAPTTRYGARPGEKGRRGARHAVTPRAKAEGGRRGTAAWCWASDAAHGREQRCRRGTRRGLPEPSGQKSARGGSAG